MIKNGEIVAVQKDFTDIAFVSIAQGDEFKSDSGSQVVFVKGISGYYSTTHVRKIETALGVEVLKENYEDTTLTKSETQGIFDELDKAFNLYGCNRNEKRQIFFKYLKKCEVLNSKPPKPKESEFDENGVMTKKYVIERIIKEEKCVLNCWNCHFNIHGPRSEEYQFVERFKFCQIVDPVRKEEKNTSLIGFDIEALKKYLKSEL